MSLGINITNWGRSTFGMGHGNGLFGGHHFGGFNPFGGHASRGGFMDTGLPHAGTWLSRLSNGHLHGIGDDYSGSIGDSSFSVSNFGSIMGGSQFGFGNFRHGGGGGLFSLFTGGGGNSWNAWGNGIGSAHGSWGGRDDDYYYQNNYDRCNNHRNHCRGEGLDWKDAFQRSGRGLEGFGYASGYGLERSANQFTDGNLLSGLGELFLAPVRGIRGMLQGCEMYDAQYANAPQVGGGRCNTNFLGG